MALGGVARRGQRQDIALVVDGHRIQVGVYPRRHLAVAPIGAGAHGSQRRRGVGRHGPRGEPDPHVVVDARLARRVDLARGELRDEDARFDPGAAPHTGEIARGQELVHGIQHVEVHDPDRRKTALFRQPGQRGRGVAVGVEREEGVAVQIDHVLHRLARGLTAFGERDKFGQRAGAAGQMRSSFSFVLKCQ